MMELERSDIRGKYVSPELAQIVMNVVNNYRKLARFSSRLLKFRFHQLCVKFHTPLLADSFNKLKKSQFKFFNPKGCSGS